ncbi:hypothetical protein JOC36_001189 [Weissella uvarum]|uniref:hypothetical protein n=1 Tax=Weissella uvarum TaxID=1479233 RepID=UPI0019605662|nr:hypothetical protein [Weissella uvarum]MBM7617627.1 hypothetical protein [Weissella uvarum]MCM0595977.1 hypothetical protein [Weissella uvarum]
MFGLKQRKNAKIQQLIEALYQQLTLVDQPESYRITRLAKQDLAADPQAAPLIATKLADSLQAHPDRHYNLPETAQPIINELGRLGHQELKHQHFDLPDVPLAYE